MIRFNCPECHKVLGVKEQMAGKKAACPQCKASFIVPAPKTPAAVDGAGAGSPAPGTATNGTSPAREGPVRVSFPCPHCHEKLKIPMTLAGRQGPCPKCKLLFTIPQVEELKALAAAQVGGASGDVEDLAASALADAQAQLEEAKEQIKIDFLCSWCDEPLQFDEESAGKQEQCPHCKRIVRVPRPDDKKPKDWREIKKAGPSLAAINQPKELEGAWGTVTDRSNVGRTALEEAGAVVTDTGPAGPLVWVRRVLVTAGILGFVGLIFFAARQAQMNVFEKHNLDQARESYEAVKLKIPRGWAALFHLSVGECLIRKEKPDSARDEFNKSFARFAGIFLEKSPVTLEEELLLIDLALTQILLGGDEEQAIHKKRLRWPEVQTDLDRTLKTIKTSDGKLLALRKVSLRLMELKQEGLALGLAKQVHAAAIVGADSEEKSVLLAEQVALLLALQKEDDARQLEPPPEDPAKNIDKLLPRLAYAQGHAYAGNFEQAKTFAQWQGKIAQHKFQAHLAIAEIALAKKNIDEAKQILEEAKKLGEPFKKTKVPPSLLMYQMVYLCARTGALEEAEAWKDLIANAGCKARAHLEILKVQAEEQKQPLSAGQINQPDAIAYPLAVLESARQKTLLGYQSPLTSYLEYQDENLRPFLYAGAALGTQGK